MTNADRRRHAVTGLLRLLYPFIFISMYASLTGNLSYRVISLISTLPSIILMPGMLLLPELRDEFPGNKSESFAFEASMLLALSSLFMLFSSADATVPPYLKYIKLMILVLLVVYFWLRSSLYRRSFGMFLLMTLGFALFSFSIIESLNVVLDTSPPMHITGVVVDMDKKEPTRLGRTVGYSMEIYTGVDTVSFALNSHDFGRHSEGDEVSLTAYEGAFGIPYYEYPTEE